MKITHADKIKPPFFNGIDNNVIFSQSMLIPNEKTGNPFTLLSRQQGILVDDYIYMGAKLAVINWQRLNKAPLGGETKLFIYSIEAYAASTISKWFSALAGFTLYQDHHNGINITPNILS